MDIMQIKAMIEERRKHHQREEIAMGHLTQAGKRHAAGAATLLALLDDIELAEQAELVTPPARQQDTPLGHVRNGADLYRVTLSLQGEHYLIGRDSQGGSYAARLLPVPETEGRGFYYPENRLPFSVYLPASGRLLLAACACAEVSWDQPKERICAVHGFAVNRHAGLPVGELWIDGHCYAVTRGGDTYPYHLINAQGHQYALYPAAPWVDGYFVGSARRTPDAPQLPVKALRVRRRGAWPAPLEIDVLELHPQPQEVL